MQTTGISNPIVVTALLSGSGGYAMGRAKKEKVPMAVEEPV
jgi:hypothetical protein